MRVLGLVLVAAGAWGGVGCAGTAPKAHDEDVVLRRTHVSERPRVEARTRASSAGTDAPGWGELPASAPAAASPATSEASAVASGPTEPPAEPTPEASEDPLAAGVRAASRASAGMGNKSKAGTTEAPAPEHPADRKVQVAGIEGTLSNFDVRVTMEAKAREFGTCHAPRLRRVPGLSGNVEFKIRVLADGTVANVELPNSDVGDRALERCFAGVIKATQFPKPRGGDANVSYTMQLSPSRKGREPEQWDADRIRHVLQKRAEDVQEMCELSSPRAYRTTIYVNRRGKVVAAGVAGKADTNGAYDCIADAVRKWPMPKARKKALAKVTFPMSSAT